MFLVLSHKVVAERMVVLLLRLLKKKASGGISGTTEPHTIHQTSIDKAGVFAGTPGGAKTLGSVLPSSAAQNLYFSFLGPAGILGRARLIVVFGIDIIAPFGDIAVHVIEPPAIRLFLPHPVGLPERVARVPGVFFQGARVTSEIALACGPRAAGVFPFRFGGKAVSVGLEITLPRPAFLMIAGLQTLGPRTEIAVQNGVCPRDRIDRFARTFEGGGIGAD